MNSSDWYELYHHGVKSMNMHAANPVVEETIATRSIEDIKRNRKKRESIVNAYKAQTDMKHSSIDDDFLAHFGILGQKWGVRRYQNKDGSLTPEGRKRYGIGTNVPESQETDSYSIKTRAYEDGDIKTDFISKKNIGYGKEDFDMFKSSIENFDNKNNYSGEQIHKALDNAFKQITTNKENVNDVKKSIQEINLDEKTYADYDPKRWGGINARQNSNGTWTLETYYTPKMLDGHDDQPWYSVLETDDIFKPKYFKYKTGGVV